MRPEIRIRFPKHFSATRNDVAARFNVLMRRHNKPRWVILMAALRKAINEGLEDYV